MEDHRVAHGVPALGNGWPPAVTREALDGPHSGGARRPPTTGMLPRGWEPDRHGPVVLLAHVMDRAKYDADYLRRVLAAVATVPGSPTPVLVCCSVASALQRALDLRPELIIIGESNAPEWHDLQLALCRRLKQQQSPEMPAAVVLLRDPGIQAEWLTSDSPADGIVSVLDRQSMLACLRRCLYGC